MMVNRILAANTTLITAILKQNWNRYDECGATYLHYGYKSINEKIGNQFIN